MCGGCACEVGMRVWWVCVCGGYLVSSDSVDVTSKLSRPRPSSMTEYVCSSIASSARTCQRRPARRERRATRAVSATQRAVSAPRTAPPL
eukprot:1811223-Prymnesium_polylepis.1